MLLALSGNNNYGQCLVPGEDDVAAPTAAALELLDGRRVVQVAVGDEHTLVLDDKGEVWAAGKNNCGQLGRGHDDGDDPDSHIARRLTSFGSERVVHIASGWDHSAALTENGWLFVWGRNADRNRY